jgi:hypothetical protein
LRNICYIHLWSKYGNEWLVHHNLPIPRIIKFLPSSWVTPFCSFYSTYYWFFSWYSGYNSQPYLNRFNRNEIDIKMRLGWIYLWLIEKFLKTTKTTSYRMFFSIWKPWILRTSLFFLRYFPLQILKLVIFSLYSDNFSSLSFLLEKAQYF